MIEPFYQDVGARVRGLRERSGLTQEHLALQLGLRCRTSLHQMESGITRLKLRHAVMLCEIFEVTMGELTGFDV